MDITKIQEEIAATEVPLQLLKIGPNAKGDVQINSNEMQLRHLARALAHPIGDVQPMKRTDKWVNAPDAPEETTYFYQFTLKDETRRVHFFDVKADEGASFMRVFTQKGIAMSNYHATPKVWADGKDRRIWETVVYKGDEVRMSRENYLRAYWHFHHGQAAMGITPSHELYINPLDSITRSTFMAMLGRNVTIGIKGNRKFIMDVLNRFFHDELASIAGIPYQSLSLL